MICKNCGEDISEGSKFCGKCGAEVSNIVPIKPVKPIEVEIPKDSYNTRDISNKNILILKGINVIGYILVAISIFLPYFSIEENFIFGEKVINYWQACDFLDVSYFYGILLIIVSILGSLSALADNIKLNSIMSLLLFLCYLWSGYALMSAYGNNISSYFVTVEYENAVVYAFVGFFILITMLAVNIYNKKRNKK